MGRSRVRLAWVLARPSAYALESVNQTRREGFLGRNPSRQICCARLCVVPW